MLCASKVCSRPGISLSEKKLKSNGDYLLCRVGSFTHCCIFDGKFHLIDKSFDRVVGVIGSTKLGVVLLKVGWRYVSIVCVQMFQNGSGRRLPIARVTVAQSSDIGLIDGGEENLAKGLVCEIVFIEACGGLVEGKTDVGDGRASGAVWDVRCRSRIRRRNKRGVGKSVVDGVGHCGIQESESAVAEIRLHGS